MEKIPRDENRIGFLTGKKRGGMLGYKLEKYFLAHRKSKEKNCSWECVMVGRGLPSTKEGRADLMSRKKKGGKRDKFLAGETPEEV